MDPIDTGWILTSAALVFVMQGGFLALETGLTRSKNSVNVAAKNLADIGIAIVLYWLFGFGLMFGLTIDGLGLIGNSYFSPDFFGDPALQANGLRLASLFIFQAMFCSTAVTIVSGAAAERMRFEGYLLVSIIISGIIYPVFGHWAWGGLVDGAAVGWLGVRGFVDFAGSTVVHSVGGWVALAVLLVLGPRRGRFGEDGRPRVMAKANLPLASLGAMLLWFGWFGFNGGSTLLTSGNAGLVITNTVLAAAAGLITVIPAQILFNRGMVELEYLINGLLVGLVSITACAPFVSPQQALIIGFAGSWLMMALDWLLLKLNVDDVVGAIPVHLGGGIWGTLAVAIFGAPAAVGTGLNQATQLGIQMIGIFSAAAWAFFIPLVIFAVLNALFRLRVTAKEEELGLNISEQGIMPDYSAYPGLDTLLQVAARGKLRGMESVAATPRHSRADEAGTPPT